MLNNADSINAEFVIVFCHERQPCAGFGVVRIDLLCFLARCHKRQLNQILSLIS